MNRSVALNRLGPAINDTRRSGLALKEVHKRCDEYVLTIAIKADDDPPPGQVLDAPEP
jgi:hypothetical protein